MEPEDDIEIDDFLSRSKYAVRDMMETDGWHLFRKMLTIERNDQVNKLIGIRPTQENLPVYGEARGRIFLIDQLLALDPGTIAEFIYAERNNNSRV